MSTNVTYETMCAALPENVPELTDAYDAELRRWPEVVDHPHVLYGNVLSLVLKSLLLDGGADAQLQRIFAFLEVLAENEDERVRNVLAVTVLEDILGHGGKPAWTKALPFMGPATSKIGMKVEKHMLEDALLGDI